MEKVKKSLIKILIILLFIVFILETYSFARIPTNNIGMNNASTNMFVEPGNKILGIIKAIGIICSVIGLMIIGLRYMMGSVEEKADYKKTLPYYLLGMVLIAGTVPFAELVYKIIQDML